jgi:CheY-like chemotaxis protein
MRRRYPPELTKPEQSSREDRIPVTFNAVCHGSCNADHVVLRIMIVDDNASFIEAARTHLEREGLRVVGTASSIADALERARELRPDVMLVDISLGDESGFELIRRLALTGGEGEPVAIVVSTHSEADFADLLAESQAIGFVPKPELSADKIRRLFEARAA